MKYAEHTTHNKLNLNKLLEVHEIRKQLPVYTLNKIVIIYRRHASGKQGVQNACYKFLAIGQTSSIYVKETKFRSVFSFLPKYYTGQFY